MSNSKNKIRVSIPIDLSETDYAGKDAYWSRSGNPFEAPDHEDIVMLKRVVADGPDHETYWYRIA